MARTQEPDIEFDPRHRIVGAIILVTLAVILLPLILDEHPNAAIQSSDSELTVAPTVGLAGNPDKAEKVVVKSLSDNSASETGKPAAAQKPATRTRVVVKKIETPGSKQQTVAAKPAPVATITNAKKQTIAAQHSKPTDSRPHWSVQVGTFSNQGNVRRLRKQLEERGYSVMFKDVTLKQGTAVRVRVGPYSSRASADKAQGKIRKDIGIKGVVVAGP